MDESFGQALRRLRGTRSLRNVAHLANCGKSYVADLEQDKKAPSPAIAAALDDALDAGGELRALAATPPGASLSAQAAALQAGAENDQLPELTADFADLNRLLTHRHSRPCADA